MTGQISLNEAVQQHQSGNLDVAARMYRSILNGQPENADALHLLGLIEHQQGRHDSAESMIRQAIAISPGTVAFYGNLAAVFTANQLWPQAEACYREGVRISPDWLDGLCALGDLLANTNQFDAAADVYRQSLKLKADSVEVLNNLGEVELRRGQLNDACLYFSEALKFSPTHPDLLNNLGNALRESGNPTGAEEHLRKAMQLRGDDPLVCFNLGLTLLDLSRFDESAECFRKAISLSPNDAESHRNLAEALRRVINLPDAEASAQRAVRLNDGDARVHATLGTVLTDAGRLSEAESCFRQALAIDPNLTVARINLGEVLRRTDHLTEAEECCRQALGNWESARLAGPDQLLALTVLGKVLRKSGRLLDAENTLRRLVELDPAKAEAHSLLAIVLMDEARIDDALAAGEESLRLDPDNPSMMSDQFLCLQYQHGVTAARLAEQHKRWEQRFGAPLRAEWKPHANSKDQDRPLRVGLVSGDFARHPVGQLIVRGLEVLRDSDIQFVCYANQFRRDDMTDRIQAAAHRWHDVWPLTDEQLGHQVRSDGIDILIDLAGHTGGNRLPIFARRPAPVQVTWLGYAGTTGLSAMDWLITDAFHLPPEFEEHCTQRVIRMAGPHIIFEPPAEAPEVGPLPADRNGYVTFGCFNNPAKLNEHVIGLQATLLNRIPDSRLILKYRGLDDPSVRQRIGDIFQGHGIDPERFELRGKSPFDEMLAQYNEIDLGLDPFPFNGGMTTLLSLWMGVPVVTQWGQTVAGRQTASFLSHIGMTDLIANDVDGYVEIVAQLASNPARLTELRMSLRDRVSHSPICNARSFAEVLQTTLRRVWSEWCQSEPA